uniref:Diphosphomevalonate decarboxylase n=1 Tax=Trichobilharzia regenti TaxID=157069 RepID=A0AA85JG56_TRIRE|nr:unnamed protein product [Trichobilharzia regenti]
MQIQVSCPINIALLKYWGKSDNLNIYPLTPSISLTLNQSQVGTITTVSISSELKKAHFKLNGKAKKFPSRLLDVLIIAQLRARLSGKTIVSPFVSLESNNNFPTAAGLASSASGTAAFAFALGKLYGLDGDFTDFSRRGSGSSCRSLSGGCVYWSTDRTDYNSHSCVQQLFPASHWPELKLLICITNDQCKPIGSTSAMQNCIETSDLFRNSRLQSSKHHEMKIIDALKSRDFSALAEATMRESNQLHAVCLDTWPPCVYLNHISQCLMEFVHQINKHFMKTVVAYTFDAGPNAFLLVEVNNIPIILSYLIECFGCTPPPPSPPLPSTTTPPVAEASSDSVKSNQSEKQLKVTGISYTPSSDPLDAELLKKLPKAPGGILYVISTEIGNGPEVISFVLEDA